MCKFSFILGIAAFIIEPAFAQSPPDLSKMTQTFDYEFQWSGIGFEHFARNYTTPATINNELEAYTPDSCQGDNVNGVGRLRVDIRAWNGQQYTSCALTTFAKFSQTYGYFVMRARIPNGKGLAPAFWMMPSSGAWPPEIDIMENTGDGLTTYMTIHFPNGSQSRSNYVSSVNLSLGYHTWALEWTPTEMDWFVDGIVRKVYTGSDIPNVPMYMLADLAVGGTWPGSPDGSTPFPSSMDIDYIRAYQFNPKPAGENPNAISLTGLTLAQNGVNVPYLATAKTGDVLTIKSTAAVGPNTLAAGGVYEIGICGYSGSPCYAFDVQSPLPALAAGSQVSLTDSYTIPSGMADGLYNVYVTVITSGGSNTSQSGTRFAIQNSPTPYIAPLQALSPALKP